METLTPTTTPASSERRDDGTLTWAVQSGPEAAPRFANLTRSWQEARNNLRLYTTPKQSASPSGATPEKSAWGMFSWS